MCHCFFYFKILLLLLLLNMFINFFTQKLFGGQHCSCKSLLYDSKVVYINCKCKGMDFFGGIGDGKVGSLFIPMR
jgi:hypothetical protein